MLACRILIPSRRRMARIMIKSLGRCSFQTNAYTKLQASKLPYAAGHTDLKCGSHLFHPRFVVLPRTPPRPFWPFDPRRSFTPGDEQGP